MPQEAKTGLTLLELLMVIAVISILAALLGAAISGIEGKARRVVCSFVDGHVSCTGIDWSGDVGSMGVSCNYDPPAEYDYQWSEN